jgi:uncharacterized membrane protein
MVEALLATLLITLIVLWGFLRMGMGWMIEETKETTQVWHLAEKSETEEKEIGKEGGFNRTLLIKICDGINKIAPQYGLPPIKVAMILPKEKYYGEVYPVEFYLDGIERPIMIYFSLEEFDDEPYLRNLVWGEYLCFIHAVVWKATRRRDIPCGVYMGGDWVIFVYHAELDMRLSVSFYPYERGKKYIKLEVEKEARQKIHEEILARGKWEELLPQFLHWYCYLHQARPEEIERIIGLALL